MHTIIERVDKSSPAKYKEVILKAAGIIAGGGLVAFPTETVYGLGANALDPEAVLKIYAAKGRPSDNPLIAHITSLDELPKIAQDIPRGAFLLAERFWPGPLTMILPKRGVIPYELTGGLNTVAIRLPRHDVALDLIREAGVPIAAPSANGSGRPSPTRASHVEYDLNGKIDMILDGGPADIGLESTVIDMTVVPPRILRPGAVTAEMLTELLGAVETHSSRTEQLSPKSPGMKYTHYSPSADVIIVSGREDKVCERINYLAAQNLSMGKNTGIMACEETAGLYDTANATVIPVGARSGMETVAGNLFKVLRRFDYLGADVILAEGFDETGLGASVMDRLLKASGYTIEYV